MPEFLWDVLIGFGWAGFVLSVLLIVAVLAGRRARYWVLTAAASPNRGDFDAVCAPWKTAKAGQSDIETQYRRRVEALLRGFANIVELHRERPDAWRQGFSAGAYFFSLAYAVVYPTLFLVVTWLTGGTGEVGGLEILPADAPWSQRPLLLFAIALPVIAVLWPWSTGGRRVVAVAIAFVVAAICAVAGAGAVAGAAAGAVAGAVAFAVAGACAVAGAGAVAVAGMFAAIAVTVAIAFSVTGAVAGAGALAGAGAITGLAIAFWAEDIGLGWFVSALYGLILIIGLLTIFALDGSSPSIALTGEDATGRAPSAPILLFVALIPATNAFIDWISLGVTRSLLVWLAQRGHAILTVLALSVLDLVIAAFFFFAVGIATTFVLALAEQLHALGGAIPPFDTTALLSSIEREPLSPDHIWIYALLGTTLLPTAFHFIVMMGGIIAGLRAGPIRRQIETYLKEAAPYAQTARRPLALIHAAERIAWVRAMTVFLPGAVLTMAVWLYVNFGAPGMRFLLTCAQAVNEAVRAWSGWPWF